MDSLNRFIMHCEELFNDMEFAGQELANEHGFDINVNNMIEQGRKELQIFSQSGLELDFFETEDKDCYPIIHSVYETIKMMSILEMIGLV